jgi:hypothetical protein
MKSAAVHRFGAHYSVARCRTYSGRFVRKAFPWRSAKTASRAVDYRRMNEAGLRQERANGLRRDAPVLQCDHWLTKAPTLTYSGSMKAQPLLPSPYLSETGRLSVQRHQRLDEPNLSPIPQGPNPFAVVSAEGHRMAIGGSTRTLAITPATVSSCSLAVRTIAARPATLGPFEASYGPATRDWLAAHFERTVLEHQSIGSTGFALINSSWLRLKLGKPEERRWTQSHASRPCTLCWPRSIGSHKPPSASRARPAKATRKVPATNCGCWLP